MKIKSWIWAACMALVLGSVYVYALDDYYGYEEEELLGLFTRI